MGKGGRWWEGGEEGRSVACRHLSGTKASGLTGRKGEGGMGGDTFVDILFLSNLPPLRNSGAEKFFHRVSLRASIH